MVNALDSEASGPGSALTGDIVLCLLCSWTRHFTFKLPLSTQVYLHLAFSAGGNPAMG